MEAVNEPRQVECGAPDFTILKKDLRLGNIECKDIGKPLDGELKADQLKRYRKALPNLIFTDYLEFRWFVRGEERGDPVRLASVVGKKLRPEPDGPEALARLLNAFLTEEIPTITGPKELAERMASLAQMIRAAISQALAVLLELTTHPHRFSELQKALPEIPSRSLARLLARLEDDGAIVRKVTSGRPARSVYSVPMEDECLREALRRLSRWASRKFGSR